MMPYRESAPSSAPESIHYGPFARRRGVIAVLVLVGLGFLGVGGLGNMITESLTCDRASGSCTLRTKYWFIPVWSRQFPIDSVERINCRTYEEGGGETLIEFKGKPTLGIMNLGGLLRDAAWHRKHRAIEDFFTNAEQVHLEVASWPPWDALIWLFVPIYIIYLLRDPLRPPSRIELIVESPHSLLVRRFWPAGVSRSETLALDSVTKVRVVRKPVPAIFEGDRDIPGAIIHLVRQDGGTCAINPEPLPGVEVHERSAEALRHALRISEPVEMVDD